MNKKRFAAKSSAIIMALSIILGGQTVLAQQNAPLEIAAATTATESNAYSDGAVRAMNFINEVRKKVGVQPLRLDRALVKSAENHALFLKTNNEHGHTETTGKPQFTGERSTDRAKAAGFDTSKTGVWEDIAFGDIIPENAMSVLLDAPLHRTSLIWPHMTLFGFGYNDHASVVNLGSPYNGHGEAAVYPYDGQTGVDIGFYGHENPNPLEGFGVDKSGYVISYVGNVASLSDIKASLTDSKGNSLDFFKLKQGQFAWHIIPKQELAYNETYTVTVENKTWSFTTVKDKETQSQQLMQWREQADLEREAEKIKQREIQRQNILKSLENPPRQFSSTDVGIRINGKYVEVTPKARIIDGVTFIPLRGVFEALGASVRWSPPPSSSISALTGERVPVTSKGNVKIYKNAISVNLSIGENHASIGNKSVQLDIAPFLSEEGSTYVPLRFASEALGAEVTWEADTMTASIILVD